MTEQFSSMERDAFHVPYLSDKIPEAVFHGQAVKTVAYLRVSTAQQDVRSQRLAILEYARKHDFRIDDFIEATASGQASEKRHVAWWPRSSGFPWRGCLGYPVRQVSNLRWYRFFGRSAKVYSIALGRHWDGSETTTLVHGGLQETGGAGGICVWAHGAEDRGQTRDPSESGKFLEAPSGRRAGRCLLHSVALATGPASQGFPGACGLQAPGRPQHTKPPTSQPSKHEP